MSTQYYTFPVVTVHIPVFHKIQFWWASKEQQDKTGQNLPFDEYWNWTLHGPIHFYLMSVKLTSILYVLQATMKIAYKFKFEWCRIWIVDFASVLQVSYPDMGAQKLNIANNYLILLKFFLNGTKRYRFGWIINCFYVLLKLLLQKKYFKATEWKQKINPTHLSPFSLFQGSAEIPTKYHHEVNSTHLIRGEVLLLWL